MVGRQHRLRGEPRPAGLCGLPGVGVERRLVDWQGASDRYHGQDLGGNAVHDGVDGCWDADHRVAGTSIFIAIVPASHAGGWRFVFLVVGLLARRYDFGGCQNRFTDRNGLGDWDVAHGAVSCPSWTSRERVRSGRICMKLVTCTSI